MFLDYFALGLLIFVALVIFYGIIVIHDIPYEIAKERNHPHQDAIHVSGWAAIEEWDEDFFESKFSYDTAMSLFEDPVYQKRITPATVDYQEDSELIRQEIQEIKKKTKEGVDQALHPAIPCASG